MDAPVQSKEMQMKEIIHPQKQTSVSGGFFLGGGGGGGELGGIIALPPMDQNNTFWNRKIWDGPSVLMCFNRQCSLKHLYIG